MAGGTPAPLTNPRRRGTILVLVSVMLVLMVILAAGFLGTARRERIVGTAVKQDANAHSAVSAAIDLIGSTFAADWLDYVDPPAGANAPASEFHDYPSPAALNGNVFNPSVPSDEWLATIAPEYYNPAFMTGPVLDENSTNPAFIGFQWWRQVSLLDSTVGFINAVTFNPLYSTATGLDPIVIDPAYNPPPDGVQRYAQTLRYIWLDDPSLTAANRSILEARMADADGDGYADSRWSELPYNSGDGLRWAGAFRIIDNNAQINVNTATAWSEDSLGQTPADIDLAGFLARAWELGVPANQTQDTKNPQRSLLSRSDDVMAAQFDASRKSGVGSLDIASTRLTQWQNLGSRVGEPLEGYSAFGFESELDLRRNFAMNRSAMLISPFEAAYFPGAGAAGSQATRLTLSLGVLRSGLTETYARSRMDLARDRRHLLTTFNGARQFRPRWGVNDALSGVSPQASEHEAYRQPLNPNLVTASTTRAHHSPQQFAAVVEQVLSGGPQGGAQYEQDIHTPQQGGSRARDAAFALTANLLAYKTDPVGALAHTPTEWKVSDGVTDYFGLRKQPFIKEVTAVLVYKDRKDDPTALPNTPGVEQIPNFTIQADEERLNAGDPNSDHGYLIIELGNPFPSQIVGGGEVNNLEASDLERFRLRVTQIPEGGGATTNTTWLSGPLNGPLENSLPVGTNIGGSHHTEYLVYTQGVASATAANNLIDQMVDAAFSEGLVATIDRVAPMGGADMISFDATLGGTLRIELIYSNVDESEQVVVDVLETNMNNNWLPNDSDADGESVGVDEGELAIVRSIQRDDSLMGTGFPAYVVEDPNVNAVVPPRNPRKATAPSVQAEAGDLVANTMRLTIANTVVNRNANLGANIPFQMILHNGGANGTGTNRYDLTSIGELGLMLTYAHKMQAGSSNSVETISQQLGKTIALKDPQANARFRFFDYFNVSPVNPGKPQVVDLPAAATLFDHFSLLAHAKDDPTRTEYEVIDPIAGVPQGSGLPAAAATNRRAIPGLININTAPPAVLRMLPYMDQSDLLTTNSTTGGHVFAGMNPDARVWEGIIAYRDKLNLTLTQGPDYRTGRFAAIDAALPPGTLTRLVREEPGFASIGELLLVRGDVSGVERDYRIDVYGRDGAHSGDSTSAFDLTPDDRVADDFEEEMLLFNKLANLVTVRTDVVTAYVVIQGRRNLNPPTAANPNAEPNYQPVVERRFVVTLDRSNVVNRGDKPRVVMFAELN